MTEMLYHTDSYLKEFDAVVTEVDPEVGTITLDKTAFFPGGGGQPCDTGRLSFGGITVQVTKTSRDADRTLHHIEGELPEIGTEIHGQIDWERRYKPYTLALA